MKTLSGFHRLRVIAGLIFIQLRKLVKNRELKKPNIADLKFIYAELKYNLVTD